MLNMISKDKFLSDLAKWSSSDNPLPSRWFYSSYSLPSETFSLWARTLANYARDIQAEQKAQAGKISEPTNILLSCNDGYYIARTRGEAIKGLRYYEAKIMPMLKNRSEIKRLIDEVFPQPQQIEMF